MSIIIRKGSAADAASYYRLLCGIQKEMPHPEWFFIDPEEEIHTMLAQGRMELWVAEQAQILSGAFALVHPGTDPGNLGLDLGLNQADLMRVVHMDTAAVLPNCRGLHLQERLMAQAERSLHDSILLCTVHPDNRYSLKNVLAQGYSIVKQCEKYGSIRYILRKDL